MKIIFIIIALTAVLIVVTTLVLDKKIATKRKKGYSSGNVNSSLVTYHKWNRILSENFLTRDGYRRVRARLSELSVYNNDEIIINSVKYYLMSLGISATVVLLGALIFRDLFSILLITLYAVVLKNIVVDKQIDNIHFRLLKQLSNAISSVRQNYLRLNSIPDSVVEAETSNELKRAFDDIYAILTSAEGEQRLEEFYASTPFKLLQTFAGVCYILNNTGDTKLRDGTSNFIQAVSMIADEVNLEVRRISLQKAKFGSLEYLPLAPVVGLSLISSFFINTIPGTTVIYSGWIGYVSRTIIILASILGYIAITRINSAVAVREDDRNRLVMSLLELPWFDRLIKNIKPKKGRDIYAKTEILRGALSRVSLKQLYGTKVLYAVLTFVFTIFCLFFAVQLGKDFVYKNVKEISLVGGENLTKEDIEKRRAMDKEFLALSEIPSDRRVKDFVLQRIPLLSPYDQDAQVKRLKEKYVSYHNAEFKWWMILIAFGLSYGAWNIPEVMLRARAWLLKTESEEDVLQLQTIIAILKNTNYDTLDTLYWLERQSRVHKNILLEAYHEYPSNPEYALYKMKSQAVLPEFKRMSDKLVLTIHQISIDEAFSDLVSERDHVMRIREINQTTSINKKRAMVSPLSMIPLGLTAVLYILLPIGILGFKEFVTALSGSSGFQ